MNRKITMIITALFATALTGAALAGDDKHSKGKVTFNELDADANGKLTMSEVSNAKDAATVSTLNKKWSELDANQDGSLDRSEFARFEPVTADPAKDKDDDY